MQGTSANLAYSDTCTVYEMLHALMLPSGNDAAISLGEWGGKKIRKYSNILQRLRSSQNDS
jgi:D-alanyl-D-alanine carboxypeptidase